MVEAAGATTQINTNAEEEKKEEEKEEDEEGKLEARGGAALCHIEGNKFLLAGGANRTE